VWGGIAQRDVGIERTNVQADLGEIAGFQKAAHELKEFLPCKWLDDRGDAALAASSAKTSVGLQGKERVFDGAHH